MKFKLKERIEGPEAEEILAHISKAFDTDYINFTDAWQETLDPLPNSEPKTYWKRTLIHERCPYPITLLVFLIPHATVDVYDEDVDVVVYGLIDEDVFYEVYLTWTGEQLAVRMYTPFEEVAEASIEIDLESSGYLEVDE